MSTFTGFEKPKSNFSRVPHSFISLLPEITTLSELKVMMYLIRHTWGFSEYGKPKKLTTDEFMNGRKKRDGSRMDEDNGTGLSADSVIDGLRRAEAHGFIVVETDKRDMGRVKKYYMLNMAAIGVDPDDFEDEGGIDNLDPTPDKLDSTEVDSRYPTEKETLKELKKENKASSLLEKKPESSKPAGSPKTKAPRPPAPSTLIIAAFLKYFGLTLLMSYKAHNAFVKWATDEIKMTPGIIAYAANSWNNDEVLNWKGKRKANIILITENWSSLTEGYQETSHQSQPARQMTREDYVDLGGI